MRSSEVLLFHNGKYVGASLGLIAFAIVLAVNLLLRLASALFSIKSLAIAPKTQTDFRRRVWLWALGLGSLLGLLHIAVLLFAVRRQVRIGDLVQRNLARLQNKDWIGFGIAILQTLGVLLLSFVLARVLVTALHYLRERMQRSEVLTGHRDRLALLLDQLRMALSTILVFSTLLLCAQLLELPEVVRHLLRIPSYIAIAVYLGRFIVGTAHLSIDVLFGLSEALSNLTNPLRYLGRFRHLSKLTRRAADYFIYVGIATWTIEQITPGTWAAQTGRLALRIIAIFYLSRVLIEVCLLLMNEFFLNRAEENPAEFQQRQTLVPVAASLLRYGIYFAAVVMSLREAGMDPSPLLAGAGVAGVAVGLGAQSFVGDLVAGFFILFENLFLVGDFIEVSGVKGKVEEVGVRVTKVRDEAGVLHSIPNGEVRKVSSHSKGYVNAVIDIPVPYSENLHKIFDLLNKKMIEVRAAQADIIGPTGFAIEELRESAVLLRTVTMVKPGMVSEMGEVIRLAFWDALVAAGVTAPYARRLIMSPAELPSALPTAEPRRRAEPEQRTDIQHFKAYNLYLALDVDDNGYIEQADVAALGQRLLENQRRGHDAALAATLRSRLEAYWKEMVRFVDRDQDGRVSREEFMQFCASLSRDLSGSAGESVEALADVLFTVCDRNGTGTLSEQEFVQFARAYGLAQPVAIAGFKLIDRDSSGQVSRQEWLRFMREVFLSRKLNDAAAVIFGPGCRDES